MALISISEVSIRFRGPPLLDGVNCQIETGQRIGLLGRNGSGKTTLMRMLCGDVEPDEGTVSLAPGTRVSLLPQDVPQDVNGNIEQVVAQGFNSTFAVGMDQQQQNKTFSGVSVSDEHEVAWKSEQQVKQILSRMKLDGETPFAILSSGMKRRVLLARSLVSSPDLLLLDEPTNHLDIEAIAWLEDFLNRWNTTLIFVTHDRMFLRKLATRILEIDRGQIFDWACDYDTFLERKEGALAAQEKQDALFDKKLAQEEVWIRTGIRARRTRNEGRVRALEQLRRARLKRPPPQSKVRMQIQEGQRSGNLVAEVEDISFSYGERQIVENFSTTIMRGDKVGIIGPNGAGKTTILQLLLGKLSPEQGSVRLGTNLQMVYFDQLREQLNDDKTVQDNVGDGYDSVEIGGQKRHIIGYLQDFLFSPERARTPARFLSGGERNRVLLAKLFAKPANLIVLDEPTNDLDSETLELLEDRLVQFQGTVMMVSHDREFLNNVVTSTIVFEPDGVREYVGGYDDWLRQRTSQSITQQPNPVTGSTRNQTTAETKDRKRRLTYKEQQELTNIPTMIEQLETEIGRLHEVMGQATFYQQPGELIAGEQARLKEIESQLARVMNRWEELEGTGN